MPSRLGLLGTKVSESSLLGGSTLWGTIKESPVITVRSMGLGLDYNNGPR